MTSKERVQAAIARRPVDRVPLGFYVVDYDIIERVIGRQTYVRNKIEIQIALWEGRRDEVAESFKVDTVEFYRKIDCADILGPSHSIAKNTTYENFMAMLDAFVALRDKF